MKVWYNSFTEEELKLKLEKDSGEKANFAGEDFLQKINEMIANEVEGKTIPFEVKFSEL